MSAYIIVMRETPVRDEEAMAEYQKMTRQMVGKYNLKPLVIYGTTESLEGTAPDGTIVLEFPNMEEARAWYHSPEYQAALPHRLRSADYRTILVDGLPAQS